LEITLQKIILCVVAGDHGKVNGVPVFIGENEEIRQSKAKYLSRILQGAVHDLGDGILVVVKH
jgi:hypothetical protein